MKVPMVVDLAYLLTYLNLLCHSGRYVLNLKPMYKVVSYDVLKAIYGCFYSDSRPCKIVSHDLGLSKAVNVC